MARLINDVADLKRHIVVSANFDFGKVLPYAKRAERKIIINLIGRDQYTEITDHVFVEGDDAPINLVKELLEEAVANYALILALPTINVLVTNSGPRVSDTTASIPADWKDKRDLNRSLYKTFNEALDDAFQIMEDNVADFPDWRDSEFYTMFNELVVKETRVFNAFFNIQKNRQTFIALQPQMREVEEQYLRPMLGDLTLQLMKTASVNPIVNRAQELARMSLVALAVAKCAETGTFSFSDTSMIVSSEQMPWEKNMELSEEKLCRLQKSRQKAGEETLKLLKAQIVANPSAFPNYVDNPQKGIESRLIRKKSGLSI